MTQASHRYDLRWPDVARTLVGPLIVAAAFAMAVNTAVRAGWLPPPRPAWDMDRAILLHQAAAARSAAGADVVLIGDSSCLMDVDAGRLQDLLPGRKVLDLGTLSYLSLDAHAVLLREYARANPGLPRLVVLLVHPELLRQGRSAPAYLGVLDDLLSARDACDGQDVASRLTCVAGITPFRDRVLARALPNPLPAQYGTAYGFPPDLWRYMDQHRGSLAAPGQYAPGPGQGSAEYRLAGDLKDLAAEFRAALPEGARVVLVITPVPESFMLADYARIRGGMLVDLAGWLGSDALPGDLPPMLPDSLFASTTHLNESGVRIYTETLARALKNL